MGVTLTNPRGGANPDEIYFKWGFPFMKALGPTLSHTAAGSGIGQYTAFAVGVDETLCWGVSIANGSRDIPGAGIVNVIQDITANVGYAFSEFSGSLNVAKRPKALLHDFNGTADGKFTNPTTGNLEAIPGNLIWLTFSYGGSVEAEEEEKN